MADTKKVDMKKMAEEAKKATESVKVAATKAASSVKAGAEKAKKATEAAATETKKQAENVATEVKKEAEKQAEAVVTETKKASETVKKTAQKATTRKTSKKKPEMTKSAVLQFGGEDFKVDEIIANAQAAFKAENKRKAISDIKVYIKPEERAAYYVVTSGESEYAGRIDL